MSSFNSQRDLSARQAAVESRRNTWAVMLTGLALGIAGMHLTAIRPLQQKLEILKREMAYIQQDLNRSIAENRVTRESLASAADLSPLQDDLIASRDRISEAAAALEEIAALRDQLENIKAVIEQDAYNVDIAAERVDALLNLKDQIIWRGANTAAAQNTVNGLLMLRDGLAAEDIDVAAAGENLERLLAMEARLARRTMSKSTPPASPEQSLVPRLWLKQPLPNAAGIAKAALKTSTAGRAYRSFEPFINATPVGKLDQQQLRLFANQILSKRPTRLSRLGGETIEVAPRRAAESPATRSSRRPLTAPVPWPVLD